MTVKASVGFFNFFNNRRFQGTYKKKGSESKEERKKERKKEKEKEGMAWNGREGLGFTIWALPNLGIPQFWRVVFCFSERPFCT
jgi:hypothetical protein